MAFRQRVCAHFPQPTNPGCRPMHMCMTDVDASQLHTFSSLLDKLLLRMSSVHSRKQRSTRLEYILRLRSRRARRLSGWCKEDGWCSWKVECERRRRLKLARKQPPAP
eukprot:361839-Chlamydomonas_euryale.AAC.15